MERRWGLPINEAGKHTSYFKLWRVDGDGIPGELWCRLVYHFFRDNPLVEQPLGVTSDAVGSARRSNPQLIEALVPQAMRAGDGVRVALAFRERPLIQSGRALLLSTNANIDSKTFPCIEPGGIELLKLLRSGSGNVSVSENARQIIFGERYCSLPVVIRGYSCEPDEVYETFKSIKRIVKRISRGDWVIRFGVGFAVGDEYVVVSVMGHVADVWPLLKNEAIYRPSSNPERFDKWFERVRLWIDEKWPVAADSPDTILARLDELGTLDFERRPVPVTSATPYFEGDDLRVKLAPEKAHTKEWEVAADVGAVSVCGVLVHSSLCRQCGQEYLKCYCSRISERAGQTLESLALLPSTWTDRPTSWFPHPLGPGLSRDSRESNGPS